MKVDELSDGGLDGRPRAQEISSAFKIIPYIEHPFTEWHGFRAELNNFLLLCEFTLDGIAPDPTGEPPQLAKYLLADPQVEQRLPIKVDFQNITPENLLVLFIYSAHIACSEQELAQLVRHLADFRWNDCETPILGMLFAVLRAALFKTIGPTTPRSSVAPTPAEYEAFRQNVTMRYPGAMPPPSEIPLAAYSAFELPKRLVQPLLGVSQVPRSIQEACEIFKERIQTPESFTQFWQEHELLTKTRIGGVPEPAQGPPSLYTYTLPFLKSFFVVFVNYILRRSVSGQEPTGVRAALGAVHTLINSSKHVLEQEFMLTLLFDLQFHLVSFKVAAQSPVVDTVLQPSPEPAWTPWPKTPQRQHRRTHSRAASTTNGIRIEKFSVTALETLILLMRLTRLSIAGRAQRLAIIAELPLTPLKQLMCMYNDDLWSEVLMIFKLQASVNHKKWRCMNMEIVSAIYIHCPFKLDDDWLTGGDTVNEVRAPTVGEETLRELIELYNYTKRR